MWKPIFWESSVESITQHAKRKSAAWTRLLHMTSDNEVVNLYDSKFANCGAV